MSVYSLAQLTSATSAAAAAWELRAGTQGFILRELGITNAAATAGQVGIGRPAAIGVTPTTPVLFQKHRATAPEADPAAVAAGALAWGTGPTVPAAFLRRASLPAAIGASVVWDFMKAAARGDIGGGIWVPASGSIVLWLIGASSAFDAYAVIDQ